MKRVHPNLSFAAAFTALAISFVGGCRNQQNGGVPNPFLAPNRVTPPATRAIMPGQAQPYYPGDTLPVMQSGVGQPANSAGIAASAVPEMPSATENLSWASPSSPSVTPVSTFDASPADKPQLGAQPTSSVVASNEPTVAIPDDGNSLRFALPASTPQPAEPQPFNPSGPMALASAQPTAQSQQPVQLAVVPSTQSATQASFSEPVITNAETATANPWRTPQVAQPTNYTTTQPLALGPPPSLPMNSVVPVATQSGTGVQLREVPSPPMPRIRIPGYDSVQPTIDSADGFRPRTSMQ